jgi:hypothetical protein
MAKRFGFDQAVWNAARTEMRAALVGRAKLRGMIPYSELIGRVKSLKLEPDSSAMAMVDRFEKAYGYVRQYY